MQVNQFAEEAKRVFSQAGKCCVVSPIPSLRRHLHQARSKSSVLFE
ncbi:uncharacterized protein J3R85_001710 [Psidium guajava]|nr:uncharacterized protein J3R85_001710 [Psidium guajava]